jgi:hypothetical protein
MTFTALRLDFGTEDWLSERLNDSNHRISTLRSCFERVCDKNWSWSYAYCSNKSVLTADSLRCTNDGVRWLRCIDNWYDRTRQIITLNALTDEYVSVGIVAAKDADDISRIGQGRCRGDKISLFPSLECNYSLVNVPDATRMTDRDIR